MAANCVQRRACNARPIVNDQAADQDDQPPANVDRQKPTQNRRPQPAAFWRAAHQHWSSASAWEERSDEHEVGSTHALPYDQGAAQSKNFQVLVPSIRRIRVDSITDGSKLRKFTPILLLLPPMGCQCVMQPQPAHLQSVRHLSPQT